MTIPTEAIIPFTLRLNALEAKIVGSPAYNATGSSSSVGESSKTAQRRLAEIQRKLEAAGEGNEGLKRIINNCRLGTPRYTRERKSKAERRR